MAIILRKWASARSSSVLPTSGQKTSIPFSKFSINITSLHLCKHAYMGYNSHFCCLAYLFSYFNCMLTWASKGYCQEPIFYCWEPTLAILDCANLRRKQMSYIASWYTSFLKSFSRASSSKSFLSTSLPKSFLTSYSAPQPSNLYHSFSRMWSDSGPVQLFYLHPRSKQSFLNLFLGRNTWSII